MARADEVRRVLFEFKGDAGDLKGSTKDATKGLDSADASAKRTSNTLMTKLKPAAIAAGAAAAAMAAKWAVEGIGMAQTAEVLADSFDKTFGDAADGFLEDNEDLRLALGLSEAEFQKQVTAIGAVNRGLHQSGQEAADFSGQVLTVAGDVAAFNAEIENADEVVEAINSALIGNTESLEKYGIEVTAAMVAQRALADSGKEAEAELTQLEKREATLALITEQSALATGALAEQTDSATVKQNQFEAQMKDVQTQVGSALIPLKELVFEVLLALVPVLEALTPLLELLADLISGITKVATPVIRALGQILEFLTKIVVAVVKLFSPLAQLARVFDRVSNSIRQAFSWTPPKWMQSLGVKGFHSGGVVPGPQGSEQIIRAQGGERVIPGGAGRRMGGQNGGGGQPQTVVNVSIQTGVGDPMEIGRQLTTILNEYARQTGTTSE